MSASGLASPFEMVQPEEMPMEREGPERVRASISCERCRKRKIRCDRRNPCVKCQNAGVECVFPGGGTRSRPAPRKYVEALENKVGSLETLVRSLTTANNAERNALLANFDSPGHMTPAEPQTSEHQDDNQVTGEAERNQEQQSPQVAQIQTQQSPAVSKSPTDSGGLVLARAREGRMCKLPTRKATRFYGSASLYQLHNTSAPLPQAQIAHSPASDTSTLPYNPKSELCRQLMATFFQHVYQYNMCIYREYFLRDYVAGGGPYYSDALMYSICAVGALISEDPSTMSLSQVFANIAGNLVFNALDLPDLTILQSLIVLGHLEIGQGRSSKGWLFCGMACRLTHEMGLHLDPNNWTSTRSESSIDREVLRRVYWAVFVVDKQLSLYFGRPPALYPNEADVHNTIRIPYPPEWESLLDSCISKGTSATAFEDGIASIGSFIRQVELAKIFHTLIVDVFENRRRQSDPDVAAATAHQVHESMIHWLAMLPQKLHWNQCTVGQVAPYVLHLHMLFHTGMIILHRPPIQHLDDEVVIEGEGVEVCYQSLSAILRLIRSFGRYYRFQVLPLDFVHTLSAAAEVVMMKKYMEKSSWEDKDIARPMEQILQTMEAVQTVYPCMQEIRQGIMNSINAQTDRTESQPDYSMDLDLELMDLLQSAGPFPSALYPDEPLQSNSSIDLGVLVTDEFLNEHYTNSQLA